MVEALNKFVEWLQGLLMKVLELLPTSPFKFDMAVTDNIRQVMGYINFFFPVQYCISLLTAWLVCIALWYVASIGMRWVKAIE